MSRQVAGFAVALVLCLSMSLAIGAPRGGGGQRPGGGGRSGGRPPGGEWSENKRSSGGESGGRNSEGGRNSSEASGAEGAAAANRNKPKSSGGEDAAAGAAAANRNKPKTTGGEDAAAGAAAATRNQPKASGAEGAAAGAAAANRNQPNVSGAAGAAAGYASVRNSFDHPNVYGQQWYADHAGAWSAANWSTGAAWTASSLANVGSYCGYANNSAVNYGYGDNVTCQNGNVLIDGQSVGTAEEFSQQAADLALAGQDAKTTDADEWLPLGVFALVRNEDQHPQLTIQLAINKQGILRGNYTDVVTDHALLIHGSVDKDTQRAAWTVGGSTSSFMEAGMSNLTQGEAPTLIHKNGKTERWLLVRLTKPVQADDAAADPNATK